MREVIANANCSADVVETVARAICREKCAQAGDKPCYKVDNEPLCDECLGCAKAALSASLGLLGSAGAVVWRILR